MFEKALTGSRRYWILLALLAAVILTGFIFYLKQINQGLMVTGMSRDISWGLYIAQFTFLVGVAASAVTVVLPYYLHDYRVFGKVTILGEFLAISSVAMCALFIFVDLGQPFRVLNVFIHPTPNSLMFWDTVVLLGYLLLNLVIGWMSLESERRHVPPPAWLRPLIYISIPWAVSIHTITAFLYAGLPGRHLWLSAIIAARFLASAFSAGPALLIILCIILRKNTRFDVGREPLQALGKIIAYALSAHVFFILLEFFTAYYSGIPSHSHSLDYLFFGLDGHATLVPLLWLSAILAVAALFLLINPNTRKKEGLLLFSAAAVFASTWIDKGIGFVVGGFIPNPMDRVVEYLPTVPEIMITLGVWAIGFFILTLLYRITVSVRAQDL